MSAVLGPEAAGRRREQVCGVRFMWERRWSVFGSVSFCAALSCIPASATTARVWTPLERISTSASFQELLA